MRGRGVERVSRKQKIPLTEVEWSRVFNIRCKSKRGEALTSEEAHLIARAFAQDPARYSALGPAAFEATKPVGAR